MQACRLCAAPLERVWVDLGASPLANHYLRPEELDGPEAFYPLAPKVCGRCFLVQLPEFEAPARIFEDYAYFTSFSGSMLAHAERFADEAATRLGLGSRSQVVEIASNDGYLLQYFAKKGIPVLGVEPAANVAEAAKAKGIPTRVEFFGDASAGRMVAEGIRADLLCGNNVFAHVPDLDGFVAGMKRVLAPRGVVTLEFPHLLRMVEDHQFDSIYHEHFSYFSLHTARAALARHGLVVFDVEEVATHGGSLRMWAAHAEDATKVVSDRVGALEKREAAAGLTDLAGYVGFATDVAASKRALLRFLLDARESGKQVVGYGAPAKAATLLNHCGIRSDLVSYLVDRSPHKAGRFLPGVRIPIHPPEMLRETRPDYVLLMPWNLKAELEAQLSHVKEWGGRLVVPVPRPVVLP